ncbi:C4BPA protein, partial [Smithornis capensis]|nr:C4BPA protein [Smithornis capensis]
LGAARGRAQTNPATIALLSAGDCSQPPRFVFAELITTPQESYPVGTKVTYRCRPGYVRNGDESPVVTCLPNSTWSEKGDFCIGKSCGQPDIKNGNFHTQTNLLLGATITFTCNIGYRLVGPPSAECVVRNGEVYWDSIPSCELILCLPPPEIKNGQLISGDREFTFGMAASYSCNQGFSLIGDATIYCTIGSNLSGTWSGPAPECKEVKCQNPQVKNGKRLSGFGTEHTYKDTVTFECNNGYRMNGSSVVTCEANSTWTPPLPRCDEIRCGPPPHFPFATLVTSVGASSAFGTQLRYRCNPGYKAAPGKSSVLICQSNDTWSAAEPDFCVREYLCSSPPPTIANGMHNGTEGTGFVYGSVVVYKCKDGFTLVGAASIRCDVDHQYRGVWSKPAPECKANAPPVGHFPCGNPPTIANGMHNGTEGTGFAYGSVVVYKCKHGFTLAGAASLQCIAGDQSQGVWNKPAPECRGDCLLCLTCILSVFKILFIPSC